MIGPYSPADWYWIIGDDETKVYSSARGVTATSDDETYTAWAAAGGIATRIDSMDSLIEVLRAANAPPYHSVPTRVIVDRLEQIDKLTAARAALDAADLYTRERWNNRQLIYADDPTAIALVQGIGADPAVILAPE